MHCNPNDRLSQQEQKQPSEAADLPRGDRDDEGNLKLGDHPQANDKKDESKQDDENIETQSDEFDQAGGI